MAKHAGSSEMPEGFRHVMNVGGSRDWSDDALKDLSERDKLLQSARETWMDFGHRYENTINHYFGTSEMRFTMKPGGWYVDLGRLEVNADPVFFLEKGYSEAEALFATFHEAEHFRDMVLDPDGYEKFFSRCETRTDVHQQYPKALKRFYNCLEDVLVNRVVMRRWNDGKKAKDKLYPKLFESTDFSSQPMHRQLMYALLREAMLPGETCAVDPKVREAIDVWQRRGGSQKALDVLTYVETMGTARMNASSRYAIIEKTLEPVFEEMYKYDLAHWEPKDKSKGKGSGEGGDPFGEDPNAGAIPDPIDFSDVMDEARRINDKITQNKKNTFKELMGVGQRDFEMYRVDLEKVAPHIKRLSNIWDAIIQRRKTYRRVLRKPVREGAVLDPRKAAIGVAEIKSGNLDPVIMLDYESKEVLRNRPNKVEITFVGDGSGSMKKSGKDVMQRQMALMSVESLADFSERIAKQRRAGEPIQLAIKSEVRIVSDDDEVVKPLSGSLSHLERVEIFKKFRDFAGGGNNEPKTFEKIFQEQFTSETIAALQKGDLKKLIIFLSDGQTDEAAVQAQISNMRAVVGPEGEKNLMVAGIGFMDGTQIITTYAPNGKYAKSLAEVPEKYQELIETFMSDV